MNTTGFKLRHLRILVLVDHVLVYAFVHEFANFRLDPCLVEGGDILARVAVE